MTTIYLIEGPVGAGKSTYAGQLALAQSAVHLNLDEWMVNLFSPDRPDTDFMPWYSERKQRCIEQIWQVTCGLLDAKVSVVLELGLVQLADRQAFYSRVDVTDYPLEVYLLDTPLALRWQRVQQRNEQQGNTFKMAVSEEIFKIANAAWEEPHELECRERKIQRVTSAFEDKT